MAKKETKSKPTGANPKSKTVKETKSKPIIANPKIQKRGKLQNQI
jgi:hypothetical protein